MIGEAWVATHYAQKQLARLRSERELFVLWGEDALHPFVFNKKLKEIDAKIELYEDELSEWSGFYADLIESETCEACEDEDASESFQEIFNDLCQIDGIHPQERFDRIIKIK